MHGDYSRPPALWTEYSVPNARDLTIWDAAQYSGLDGVNGGSWSPKTPIGIGGVGMSLGANSLFTGGFITAYGGRYTLGDSDYPTFTAGNRTRTLRFPLRGVAGTSGVLFRVNETISGRTFTRAGWYDSAAPTLYLPIPQRFVHNGTIGGATLTNITVTMFYTTVPSGVPGTTFQAVLYDTESNTAYTPSTQWQATHGYTTGQLVIPLGAAAQTGYYYKALSNFTSSGLGQPTPWGSVIGGTTNELSGGGTWENMGYAGTIAGTAYSAAAQVGTPFTFKITPSSSLELNVAHSYMLVVTQDGNPWVYTCCELDYGTIANMAFE